MTEKLTIQVPVELEDEFFDDIVTTMLEGGSNYWIGRIVINHPDGEKPKGTPTSTWAAAALNKGGSVLISPQCVEDGKDLPMNKYELVAGLKQWIAKQSGKVPMITENGKTTLDAGDIDGDDADAILQYALFGKLVFG